MDRRRLRYVLLPASIRRLPEDLALVLAYLLLATAFDSVSELYVRDLVRRNR